MFNKTDVILKDEKIYLVGDINFSTVMSVYQKSLFHLKKCNQFCFDFSELNSINSAGLALLIEWIKFAKKYNKPIIFENLSSDLLTIAKAHGIYEIVESYLLTDVPRNPA